MLLCGSASVEHKPSTSGVQVTTKTYKPSASEKKLSAFRPTIDVETAGNADLQAESDYTWCMHGYGKNIQWHEVQVLWVSGTLWGFQRKL